MNYLTNLFHRLINLLNSSYRLKPELKNNIKYKNIHTGRRCFIIGNGSSLKEQDLSPLSDEITFVMNAFWKHPVISSAWQPTYYCFADPLTFDGSVAWTPFFINLNKKIKKSLFFIPAFGKKIVEKYNMLPIDKTFYVLFDDCYKLIKDIDLASKVPSVQSTSQLALEIAIYMGCSPIYLLGMDHDWLAHRGRDRHFYESKTVENHLVAHGDLSKNTYKSELESCLRLWQKYEYLKKIADGKGIKIYNATEGGFLDVFPRKILNKVI